MDSEVVRKLNEGLLRFAGRFENIYVVDVESLFDEILMESRGEIPLNRLDVDNDGKQDIYLDKFGGFFSLDYLHPTNTGYVIYANEFIRKINQSLGTYVPEVDTAAVFASDPLAPKNFSDEVLDFVGIPH